MPRVRTLEERLMGAAILKTTFRLRGELDSAAFRAIYPGVLSDLDLEDAQVDQFLRDHGDEVEHRARTALNLQH